ncbi:MAG: ferritin family protein, partial [Desulfobacterales bacterium]|nr:ferritin family protein [Desulfobacterales bacterium]
MDLQEYKKIVEMAIGEEEAASIFYQEASDRVEDPYLKKMFAELAEDERGHKRILEKFLNSESIRQYFRDSVDFKVSETVDKPELSMQMRPADAIALAMKNEEDAMRQYQQMAAACDDPDKKRVFEDLAAMERGHKNKMEKAFVD